MKFWLELIENLPLSTVSILDDLIDASVTNVDEIVKACNSSGEQDAYELADFYDAQRYDIEDDKAEREAAEVLEIWSSLADGRRGTELLSVKDSLNEAMIFNCNQTLRNLSSYLTKEHLSESILRCNIGAVQIMLDQSMKLQPRDIENLEKLKRFKFESEELQEWYDKKVESMCTYLDLRGVEGVKTNWSAECTVPTGSASPLLKSLASTLGVDSSTKASICKGLTDIKISSMGEHLRLHNKALVKKGRFPLRVLPASTSKRSGRRAPGRQRSPRKLSTVMPVEDLVQ